MTPPTPARRLGLTVARVASIVLLTLAGFGSTLALGRAEAQPPPESSTSTSSAPPATSTTTATTTATPPPPTTPSGESTTDTPASEPAPSETPATVGDAGAETTTTLPTGPPPGFTEEQFQTFINVVTACGPDPGTLCRWVLGWSGNETLAEAVQWTADVPVRMLIIFAAAVVANWMVRRMINRYMRRLATRSALGHDEDSDYDQRRLLRMTTASASIASAATVAIFTVAIFLALGQLNINLGPLLAGAGIIGVALGFGAQNVVRDVLAGFFVLVEDQYGIGDVIDAGKASGTVEGISLRVTKIRDLEGTLWFVPNGMVEEIGNKTQRWSRVILDVDVAYGADHHEAERLIKAAADELWLEPNHGDIIEEPELWGVEKLGESSVTIRIAVKSAPADQWKVARELRSRIKDSFDMAGIEIPFPQQTIWVRDETPTDQGP